MSSFVTREFWSGRGYDFLERLGDVLKRDYPNQIPNPGKPTGMLNGMGNAQTFADGVNTWRDIGQSKNTQEACQKLTQHVTDTIAQGVGGGMTTATMAIGLGLTPTIPWKIAATAFGVAYGGVVHALLKDILDEQVNDRYDEVVAPWLEPAMAELNDEFGDIVDENGHIRDDVKEAFRDLGDDFARKLFPLLGRIPQFIDDLKDAFGDAEKTSSPLILDMDGDGHSFVGTDNSNAFFDLDADGFTEWAGWNADNDDAFLVRDLNGNGLVDDISELFGNAETDGFTELAPLDSNQDSVFDMLDADWDQVQLWFDHDGDGWTDEGELAALSDHVEAIDLDATLVNEDYNGNTVTHRSSFTRSDNTTGQVVDVWFSYDNTISDYQGNYTLTSEVLMLPYLQGYGDLKPLDAAMVEDATLQGMVREFVGNIKDVESLGSIPEWRGSMQKIIWQWTDSTNIDPESRGAHIDARDLHAYEEFMGREFQQQENNPIVSNPGSNATKVIIHDGFYTLLDALTVRIAVQVNPSSILNGAFAYNSLKDQIEVHPSVNILDLAESIVNAAPENKNQEFQYWRNQAALLRHVFADAETEKNIFDQEVQKLVAPDSAYYILQDYIIAGDKYTPAGDDNHNHLYGSDFDDRIKSNGGDDQMHGFWGEDELLGGEGNDTLYGDEGQDTLNGDKGNDVLYGGVERDFLNGHDDDDMLYGEDGNDNLYGGSGVDALYAGDGDDFIEGGAGNDNLNGDDGNDTYHFEENFGHDRIKNYGEGWETDIDAVSFGEGITSDRVRMMSEQLNQTPYGSDPSLVFYVDNGEAGTVSVINGLYAKHFAVNEVRFADGEVWNLDEGMTLEGTDEHENIFSLEGDDKLYGYGGRDSMKGNSGNDSLYGGAGNDALRGEYGDDYLQGDGGDDRLYGYHGSDIYFFDWHDGNDEIYESYQHHETPTGTDEIHLDAMPGQVRLYSDNYSDLHIKIGQNGADIKVRYQMSDANNRIEKLVFNDGTIWNISEELFLKGTSGKDKITGSNMQDTIYGYDGKDQIYASSADDKIFGGNGDDTLHGGDGVDSLYGGRDNDTLYGDKGDDYLKGEDGDDEAQGGDGNDLIKGGNGQDKIYGNAGNDEIWGEDGSDFLIGNEGDDYILKGSYGQDKLFGGQGNDALYGEKDDDILYSDSGNDSLYGGDGNDMLAGWTGDDYLDGGTGDDLLRGQGGNDAYFYKKGDGNDEIRIEDDAASFEKLILDDLNANNIWFSQTGHDLKIETINTPGQILIDDWFKSANNQLDQIELQDNGARINTTDINILISQMAAFGVKPDATLGTTQETQGLWDQVQLVWS